MVRGQGRGDFEHVSGLQNTGYAVKNVNCGVHGQGFGLKQIVRRGAPTIVLGHGNYRWSGGIGVGHPKRP